MTDRELDLRAVQAKADEPVLEDLLFELEPFLLSTASKYTHTYVTRQDDAWSVTLGAFQEAIASYSMDKGSFLSFLRLLIQRRLIDALRAAGREPATVPLEQDFGIEGSAASLQKGEGLMKGVIVEIKNGKAIVLSDDGCVTQIRNQGHQIGEVILMNNQTAAQTRPSFAKRKFAAMAASIAALLLVSGGSAWAYATPYSYVSLDVNPSITYTVNLFDRVIDYDVNDDAEQLLISNGAIQLKNMALEQAVKATIEAMVKDGYLKTTTNAIYIVAASNSDEKTAKLVSALEEEVADIVKEQGITDAAIEAEAIGLERVELARELSVKYDTRVSPGKLNLLQKMTEAASGAAINNDTYKSEEDWLENASVKDIMKATKELKEAQRDALKQDRKTDQDDEDQNVSTSAIQNQNKPDDDDNDLDNNDDDKNKSTTASAIKDGKVNPSVNHSNKGGNPSGSAIDDGDDDDDEKDND